MSQRAVTADSAPRELFTSHAPTPLHVLHTKTVEPDEAASATPMMRRESSTARIRRAKTAKPGMLTKHQSLRHVFKQQFEDHNTGNQLSRYDARKLFDSLDTDGNGELDVDELQQYFARGGLNCARDEILLIVSEMDTDGNGLISFDEFLLLLKKLAATTGESNKEAFLKMIPPGPFCGRCTTERDRSWSKLRTHIWYTFDDPKYSKVALLIAAIIFITVLISTSVLIMETVPGPHLEDKDAYFVLDIITVSIFTAEFICRVLFTPNHSKFFLDPLTWVDLCSFIPFYLEVSINPDLPRWSATLQLLRILRILRVFKLTRFVESLQLLQGALIASVAPLSMAFFLMFVGLIIFASLMYFVERGELDRDQERYEDEDGKPTQFQNAWDGFWWALITVTTVGYGDVVPVTGLGKFIGAVVMAGGTVLLGFPISIFSANFGDLYDMATRRNALRKEMNQNMYVRLQEGRMKEERAMELPHYTMEEARQQIQQRADRQEARLHVKREGVDVTTDTNPTMKTRRDSMSVENDPSAAPHVGRLELYERSSFLHTGRRKTSLWSHRSSITSAASARERVRKSAETTLKAARSAVASAPGAAGGGGGGDEGGGRPPLVGPNRSIRLPAQTPSEASSFWWSPPSSFPDGKRRGFLVDTPEAKSNAPRAAGALVYPSEESDTRGGEGGAGAGGSSGERKGQKKVKLRGEEGKRGGTLTRSVSDTSDDGNGEERGRGRGRGRERGRREEEEVTGEIVVDDEEMEEDDDLRSFRGDIDTPGARVVQISGLDAELADLGAQHVSVDGSVGASSVAERPNILTAHSFKDFPLEKEEDLAVAVEMLIHNARTRIWREVRSLEESTRERLMLEIARRWKSWFCADKETVASCAKDYVKHVDISDAIHALQSPVVRSSFAISPRVAMELARVEEESRGGTTDDMLPGSSLEEVIRTSPPTPIAPPPPMRPRRLNGLSAPPPPSRRQLDTNDGVSTPESDPSGSMTQRSQSAPMQDYAPLVTEGMVPRSASDGVDDSVEPEKKDSFGRKISRRSPRSRVEEVRTKRTVHRRIVDPETGRTSLVTEETTEVVRRVTRHPRSEDTPPSNPKAAPIWEEDRDELDVGDDDPIT